LPYAIEGMPMAHEKNKFNVVALGTAIAGRDSIQKGGTAIAGKGTLTRRVSGPLSPYHHAACDAVGATYGHKKKGKRFPAPPPE
jgi:hypothetical protein